MSDLIIIDDDVNLDAIQPKDRRRGLKLDRPFARRAYGDSADAFPADLVIPREQWADLIRQREADHATNRERMLDGGVKIKDQDGTNFCWAFAPTLCVEIARANAGQPYVSLSPASVACPITNYRNIGGWGKDALDGLRELGAVPSELWPDISRSKKNATDAANTARAFHRAVEWWELQNSLDHLVSALLRGFVVAVGYNWWGHEVTAVDPVIYQKDIAILIANSWGEEWSDKGFGLITGRKMVPDDAVVCRTAIAA